MHQLGVLSRLPRMLGTQAAGAAPLVHALDSGASDIVPVEAHTVADHALSAPLATASSRRRSG
jgi:hypothetical protein